MNGRTKDGEVDEIYTPPGAAKKLLEKKKVLVNEYENLQKA